MLSKSKGIKNVKINFPINVFFFFFFSNNLLSFLDVNNYFEIFHFTLSYSPSFRLVLITLKKHKRILLNYFRLLLEFLCFVLFLQKINKNIKEKEKFTPSSRWRILNLPWCLFTATMKVIAGWYPRSNS